MMEEVEPVLEMAPLFERKKETLVSPASPLSL